MSSNQNGFSPLHTVLMLVFAALVVGTGYYVYQATNKADDALSNAEQGSLSNISSKKQIEVPADWVWYESKELGFKFAYPKVWGEVSIEVGKGVDYDKDNSGLGYPDPIRYKGTSHTGSFSKKIGLQFHVLSADHEREFLGGGGALQDVYDSFVSGYKKSGNSYVLTYGDQPKEEKLSADWYPKEFSSKTSNFLVYSDAKPAIDNVSSFEDDLDNYSFYLPQVFTVTNLKTGSAYPGILFTKQLTGYDINDRSGNSYTRAIAETKSLKYSSSNAWSDPDLIPVSKTISSL